MRGKAKYKEIKLFSFEQFWYNGPFTWSRLRVVTSKCHVCLCLQGGALSLEVDEDCWLKNVTFVSCEFEANSVLYRKGESLDPVCWFQAVLTKSG